MEEVSEAEGGGGGGSKAVDGAGGEVGDDGEGAEGAEVGHRSVDLGGVGGGANFEEDHVFDGGGGGTGTGGGFHGSREEGFKMEG